MTSCSKWGDVSAALDGELPDTEADVALQHAEHCPTCSTALDVTAHFAPDHPPHIAAAQQAPAHAGIGLDEMTGQERRWLDGKWTRRLLLVAAIVIVAEAIPSYISGGGSSAESHAVRHLAAWQVGFGVGLFVAAWVSRMSHAMLALAATFATLTIIASAIDVIGGHSGPLAEPVHLVELIGVFLLWRLTPPHLLPWRRRSFRQQEPERAPRSTTLRIVQPKPGGERRAD